MSAGAGACRRALLRGGMLALALLITFDSSLRAQDPVPRPRRDSIPLSRDTLRADTLRADTLPALEQEPDTVIPPAVLFPAMPLEPAVNASGSEWVWDRETLLREAPVSLIDLLEQVPGITTLRAGTFAQPEAAALFGGTAGRTEIVVDGYTLDPLAAASFDLAQIPLGSLREVRVQRRLGLLRINLVTEFPVEGRPYTRVEAGVGIPTANMFRGLFLVPDVIVGPLGLGIERVDTDGAGRSQPAGLFSGWAKWAWTDGRRGIQAELLRSSLRRERSSPWLLDRTRQDIIVRARNQFSPAFVAELYAGHARFDQTIPSTDEETPDVSTEGESIQAGIRAGLQLPWLTLNAAARYRSEEHLPVGEGWLDLETELGPLRLEGELGAFSWEGSDPAVFTAARAELAVWRATAFGEVTHGGRGYPAYGSTTADRALFVDRSGFRAGLALDLGRAAGSVAVVNVDQSLAVPFGLPFDVGGPASDVEAAQGLEAHGRLVLWPRHLTLSSWITDWRDAPGWTYLPSRSWRTALELHWLPLASGNLEIFGRAEAHMRGSALAYDPAPAVGATGFLTVPGHTTADGYLHIRIIDVRMFIRWEDMLGTTIEELPGRLYNGPRIFYGVKWELRN